jgi:hypothetical protein
MLLLELLMAGAVAAAPQTATPQSAPARTVVPLIQKTRIYIDGQPVILPRCDSGELIQTVAKARPPETKRLGDLPKANFERTVNRTVDGCVKPAVVSYSVGK